MDLEEAVETSTYTQDVGKPLECMKTLDNIPKIMMSSELVIETPHAAGLSSADSGSWYEGLIEKGAGGAGAGWKYGYKIDRIWHINALTDIVWTYRLRLNHSHPMVVRVDQVVLIKYMVFS